jgi:LuxR family maltose regulon positive regulatory protein
VLRERGSITENRHRWFVAMAQVRAARGDVDAASRLLDEAEGLYRRGFYPEVRPIAAMRARVQITNGNLAPAADWALERGVKVDDDPDYLREYDHLTLVRLLLAQERPAAALDLLDRLHTAALRAERDGSVLEVRVLQALSQHALGERSRALATLERCLAEAPEPDSYVRLYLDEGATMLGLLRLADDAGGEPQRLALRILGRVGRPTPVEVPQSLVDPLSHRELEVLRLLDGDLTGPQIAAQLYVSLNTLRTHTKRIFTKLGVTTRADAVRRARGHGLL